MQGVEGVELVSSCYDSHSSKRLALRYECMRPQIVSVQARLWPICLFESDSIVIEQATRLMHETSSINHSHVSSA